MNAEYTDSCRPLFRKLNILPIYSQYIFSLSAFVVKNTDQILQYTVLITDKALTYIHQQIWQKHKKQHITPELKFSIIYH